MDLRTGVLAGMLMLAVWLEACLVQDKFREGLSAHKKKRLGRPSGDGVRFCGGIEG